MLAHQRQATILERLQHAGAARVSELTEALGVSDMTIRRDLESMAERGLVEKVHGGAIAVGQRSADEPGFEAKSTLAQGEKEGIARCAAAMVRPGTAIALSGGTTTWTMARLLGDVPRLTIVTNSISVADILDRTGRPDQTVVLTGGIRTPSNALIGPVAVSALRQLHVDLLFMGVHGMDSQRYDNAFAQCMVLLGHQMPGMASYRRTAPSVPPPPPGYPPPNTRPPSMPPPNTPAPVGIVAPA